MVTSENFIDLGTMLLKAQPLVLTMNAPHHKQMWNAKHPSLIPPCKSLNHDPAPKIVLTHVILVGVHVAPPLLAAKVHGAVFELVHVREARYRQGFPVSHRSSKQALWKLAWVLHGKKPASIVLHVQACKHCFMHVDDTDEASAG